MMSHAFKWVMCAALLLSLLEVEAITFDTGSSGGVVVPAGEYNEGIQINVSPNTPSAAKVVLEDVVVKWAADPVKVQFGVRPAGANPSVEVVGGSFAGGISIHCGSNTGNNIIVRNVVSKSALSFTMCNVAETNSLIEFDGVNFTSTSLKALNTINLKSGGSKDCKGSVIIRNVNINQYFLRLNAAIKLDGYNFGGGSLVLIEDNRIIPKFTQMTAFYPVSCIALQSVFFNRGSTLNITDNNTLDASFDTQDGVMVQMRHSRIAHDAALHLRLHRMAKGSSAPVAFYGGTSQLAINHAAHLFGLDEPPASRPAEFAGGMEVRVFCQQNNIAALPGGMSGNFTLVNVKVPWNGDAKRGLQLYGWESDCLNSAANSLELRNVSAATLTVHYGGIINGTTSNNRNAAVAVESCSFEHGSSVIAELQFHGGAWMHLSNSRFASYGQMTEGALQLRELQFTGGKLMIEGTSISGTFDNSAAMVARGIVVNSDSLFRNGAQLQLARSPVIGKDIALRITSASQVYGDDALLFGYGDAASAAEQRRLIVATQPPKNNFGVSVETPISPVAFMRLLPPPFKWVKASWGLRLDSGICCQLEEHPTATTISDLPLLAEYFGHDATFDVAANRKLCDDGLVLRNLRFASGLTIQGTRPTSLGSQFWLRREWPDFAKAPVEAPSAFGCLKRLHIKDSTIAHLRLENHRLQCASVVIDNVTMAEPLEEPEHAMNYTGHGLAVDDVEIVGSQVYVSNTTVITLGKFETIVSLKNIKMSNASSVVFVDSRIEDRTSHIYKSKLVEINLVESIAAHGNILNETSTDNGTLIDTIRFRRTVMIGVGPAVAFNLVSMHSLYHPFFLDIDDAMRREYIRMHDRGLYILGTGTTYLTARDLAVLLPDNSTVYGGVWIDVRNMLGASSTAKECDPTLPRLRIFNITLRNVHTHDNGTEYWAPANTFRLEDLFCVETLILDSVSAGAAYLTTTPSLESTDFRVCGKKWIIRRCQFYSVDKSAAGLMVWNVLQSNHLVIVDSSNIVSHAITTGAIRVGSFSSTSPFSSDSKLVISNTTVQSYGSSSYEPPAIELRGFYFQVNSSITIADCNLTSRGNGIVVVGKSLAMSSFRGLLSVSSVSIDCLHTGVVLEQVLIFDFATLSFSDLHIMGRGGFLTDADGISATGRISMHFRNVTVDPTDPLPVADVFRLQFAAGTTGGSQLVGTFSLKCSGILHDLFTSSNPLVITNSPQWSVQGSCGSGSCDPDVDCVDMLPVCEDQRRTMDATKRWGSLECLHSCRCSKGIAYPNFTTCTSSPAVATSSGGGTSETKFPLRLPVVGASVGSGAVETFFFSEEGEEYATRVYDTELEAQIDPFRDLYRQPVCAPHVHLTPPVAEAPPLSHRSNTTSSSRTLSATNTELPDSGNQTTVSDNSSSSTEPGTESTHAAAAPTTIDPTTTAGASTAPPPDNTSPSSSNATSSSPAPPNATSTEAPTVHPPPPPPTPKISNIKVTVGDALAAELGSEEAADTVTTAGISASASASVLSPTLAVQGSRSAQAGRLLACAYADEGNSTIDPDVRISEPYLELPLQFDAWGANAYERSLNGIVLYHALLMLLPCGFCLWKLSSGARFSRGGGSQQESNSSTSSSSESSSSESTTTSSGSSDSSEAGQNAPPAQQLSVGHKVAGAMWCATAAYFTANMIRLGCVALKHGGSPIGGLLAFAAALGCGLGCPAYFLLRQFDAEFVGGNTGAGNDDDDDDSSSSSSDDDEELLEIRADAHQNKPDDSLGQKGPKKQTPTAHFVLRRGGRLGFIEIFGPFFDGSRDATKPARVAFLVEISAAAVFGLAIGISETLSLCVPSAITIIIANVAYVAYLFLVRPMRSAIEEWSLRVIATLQLGFGVACAATVISSDEGVQGNAITAVAFLGMTINIVSFGAVGIIAGWHAIRFHRRRTLALMEDSDDDSSGDKGRLPQLENPRGHENPLQEPLLEVPAPTHAPNPLDGRGA